MKISAEAKSLEQFKETYMLSKDITHNTLVLAVLRYAYWKLHIGEENYLDCALGEFGGLRCDVYESRNDLEQVVWFAILDARLKVYGMIYDIEVLNQKVKVNLAGKNLNIALNKLFRVTSKGEAV